MMWGRICANGKTPLVFVNQGSKWKRVCADTTSSSSSNLIDPETLWRCRMNFSVWFRASPQVGNDSGVAQSHFPGVLSSAYWPQYSPDLNQLTTAYRVFRDQALRLDQQTFAGSGSVIAPKVDQNHAGDPAAIAKNFTNRLTLGVAAKESHFEITLKY